MNNAVKILIDYIEYHATCPCCEEVKVCVSDCTFENDDAIGHNNMIAARQAIFDYEGAEVTA